MRQDLLDSIIDRLPASLAGANDRNDELESSALLALRARDAARYEAVSQALPREAIFAKVERTWLQLQDRSHGRLQLELELVWQAIAPKETG